MKMMKKLFNDKKGFTLIEMIITTLILSILMSITMGMISTSGRIFTSTADAGIDKQVGDAIFESLESVAKYATHIELANSKASCQKSYEQGFYINETDINNKTGILIYDKRTDNATRYMEKPYPDDFYQKRTVKYNIEPYKYSDYTDANKHISDRHLNITVFVYRDGQLVYKRTNTVKCINLGLLGEGESFNLIENNATIEQNQYINFSCDEQLILSAVDGYDLFSKASKTMAEYNYINSVLSTELNLAYTTYPSNPTAREAAMTLAANTARQAIYELFGNYRPSDKFPTTGDLKYFNGVQATREEVYYGVLKKNYGVNGVVKVDSYQIFKDPVNFFKNSTFSAYGGNMVQLVLYYMNTGTAFDATQKMYSPSQIVDFNLYSVRWNDWFTTTTTTGILWWKKTETNVLDVTNPTNSLGKIIDSKKSFNNVYTVYHPLRNTWYYQPNTSTALGVWWNKIWSIDDKPIIYNVGNKSSTNVMTDIDSNVIAANQEITIGFGPWKRVINVDVTNTTLWNALPTGEINLPG